MLKPRTRIELATSSLPEVLYQPSYLGKEILGTRSRTQPTPRWGAEKVYIFVTKSLSGLSHNRGTVNYTPAPRIALVKEIYAHVSIQIKTRVGSGLKL